MKKDSIYTRSEKDKVIPMYGNLEILKQTEEYLNKTKNYKDNYLHITIHKSWHDWLQYSPKVPTETWRIKATYKWKNV